MKSSKCLDKPTGGSTPSCKCAWMIRAASSPWLRSSLTYKQELVILTQNEIQNFSFSFLYWTDRLLKLHFPAPSRKTILNYVHTLHKKQRFLQVCKTNNNDLQMISSNNNYSSDISVVENVNRMSPRFISKCAYWYTFTYSKLSTFSGILTINPVTRECNLCTKYSCQYVNQKNFQTSSTKLPTL